VNILTQFGLQEAMNYASLGQIETWIHNFLNDEGNNAGLSEGLKQNKKYFYGPIEIEINRLARCCGPESHMEYIESEESWSYTIAQICERINSGWDMPPLIIQNRNGLLSVRDGNHRLGALEKLEKEKCHVIIWDDHSLENIKKVLGK
jgi:hypothetical protein